jgi:8-amino-7-oxononanoate synthase
MLDFTSALYLGLRHDSRSLAGWSALTSGTSAALAEPPEAGALAQALAAKMGFARGLLGPSTLHVFHDLFEVLARRPVALFLDAAVYPIARWGAERALLMGAPAREVRHFDAGSLRREVARADRRRRPVVVVDGFCPGCGRVAPLGEYVEAARSRGGWLVVDDTQALGVLGRDPDRAPPYGRGGGGTLQHEGVSGEGVIVVSSLAKGWGVPLAVAAGDEELVSALADAPTRVHCSPPSAPTLRAVEHALGADEKSGEARRRRLAQVVQRFREGLSAAGLTALGAAFPIQRLRLPPRRAAAVYRRLLAEGVRTVMVRARCTAAHELSLLFTARHRDDEIDLAIAALARAAHDQPTREPCAHSLTPTVG